jgi:hypothetical protein
VVFFYPADFTFVCPTELGDLADHYAEFKKLGVEIYSVSTDTHFTHKAWHDTSETIGKINYPMIGDPTGAITRNFGVMIEEAGLAERGTFVIDPAGQDPDHRDQRRRHRPRRLPSCCARSRPPSTSPPPGRGLPRQVEGRRSHPGAVAGPGRQDLSANPLEPRRRPGSRPTLDSGLRRNDAKSRGRTPSRPPLPPP